MYVALGSHRSYDCEWDGRDLVSVTVEHERGRLAL